MRVLETNEERQVEVGSMVKSCKTKTAPRSNELFIFASRKSCGLPMSVLKIHVVNICVSNMFKPFPFIKNLFSTC